MKWWRFWCLPALAAPLPIAGHILAQSIASGHGLLAVALEPDHLYELGLSLLLLPLWAVAARSRLLALGFFAFTALTLLLEGNGLSASMLAVAIAVAALFSAAGGSVVQAVIAASAPEHVVRGRPRRMAFAAVAGSRGPSYVYVAAGGNRAPPLFGSASPH